MSNTRYHSLDSLRGIASLQVLIAHSLVAISGLDLLMFNDPNKHPHTGFFFMINSPLSFLWSDSAAVKVFFVLSGFVLSLPYYKINKSDPYYPGFFFKRIVRLYIPCFAIILISIFLKAFTYIPNHVNEFGNWVIMMWTIPIDLTVLFKTFFLIGDLDYFDRALWTLPPEIKLSLILPIIIFLIRKTNIYWNAIIVLIYITIWHTLNKMGMRNIWSDYPVLYYFTFFILGSIVCKYRLKVTNWMNSISPWKYVLFIATMFYLYTAKNSLFWLPAKPYHIVSLSSDYISSVSAVMILCLVLSERSQKLMNSAVLIFLGRISFSLYLIHIVIIETFAQLIGKTMNPALTVGLAFICCFPIATIFYHSIEVPSMHLANYVSKSIVEHHTFKKMLAFFSK